MTSADRQDTPIACNLDALSPSERVRRAELAARIRDRSTGLSESPGGYAIRLPPEAEICRTALELCLLERRCCPFLELELGLEPAAGPAWLRVSGPPGVKEFLAANGVLGCAEAGSDACC